jgi:murein DD-endopeptidase MepM/ murein hydrolase activator NlpD
MQVFPIKTGPLTAAHFAQRFSAGQHEGTDIFSPAGAEVLAVADGKVRHADEETGGKVVYLTEPDGSQYFYGHLAAFADPMPPGKTRSVKAGELLGYVGTTGNALGAPPHLHFEYRPKGQGKVDPFPELKRLADPGPALAVTPRPPAKARPRMPRPLSERPVNVGPKFGGLGLLLVAYLFVRGYRNGR